MAESNIESGSPENVAYRLMQYIRGVAAPGSLATPDDYLRLYARCLATAKGTLFVPDDAE